MPPPFDLVPLLLGGLGITITLTVVSAVVALVAAVTAGLARLSSHGIVRFLATVYVEIFRGTSALVQLFWVYFALPMVGIELNAFAAGVAVLGLNSGAYGSEIVRGAIRAVPRGQWEATAALNLSRGQAMRWVILPQAAVAMLPPATNVLVELLKNTALVSLITISDLTFRAQVLRAGTLRSGEIFVTILVLYFLVGTVLTGFMHSLERRAGRGLAHGGHRL